MPVPYDYLERVYAGALGKRWGIAAMGLKG
jgi:hypothetical protein